jgi:Prokaryotic N-terminal methylation motif
VLKSEQCSRTVQYRRGFSLIEAAIVLGIIGLVIGGIWIAATSVNKRLFVNDMVSMVSVAFETIRRETATTTSDTNDKALNSWLSIKMLPGSPTYYNDFCLGFSGFCTNYTYSSGVGPSGHIYGELSFRTDTSGYSGWVANPRLCIELSKLLLRQPYVDQNGFVAWNRYTPTFSQLGTWSGGAPPSTAQIATYCASAQELVYSGMSP